MIDIRPLRPEDDRQSFASGDTDLDRFFRKYAGQNQFRLHIGTTYVAVSGPDILGFITVAAASITIDDLPVRVRKRLPRYPLPALRIARVAVAQSARDQGIGKRLLRFALRLAQEMTERMGCVGVVVDAKADAVDFYERCGFESLDVIAGRLPHHPSPHPMFLPVGSIPAGRMGPSASVVEWGRASLEFGPESSELGGESRMILPSKLSRPASIPPRSRERSNWLRGPGKRTARRESRQKRLRHASAECWTVQLGSAFPRTSRATLRRRRC